MRKIFCYELRRLLWNRFFLGIALALLFYGWQVLGGVTILGVSHTAPFSPWSFGDYLSRMLPLLWIGALFFLTFFTSDKARRAAVLTNATQMPPNRYALARCAAALLGTGLLALCCLAEAAVFYKQYFDWHERIFRTSGHAGSLPEDLYSAAEHGHCCGSCLGILPCTGQIRITAREIGFKILPPAQPVICMVFHFPFSFISQIKK